MRWRAEEAPLPFTGAAVREPQPAISDPLEALRVLVVLLVVLLAEAREGLEKRRRRGLERLAVFGAALVGLA